MGTGRRACSGLVPAREPVEARQCFSSRRAWVGSARSPASQVRDRSLPAWPRRAGAHMTRRTRAGTYPPKKRKLPGDWEGDGGRPSDARRLTTSPLPGELRAAPVLDRGRLPVCVPTPARLRMPGVSRRPRFRVSSGQPLCWTEDNCPCACRPPHRRPRCARRPGAIASPAPQRAATAAPHAARQPVRPLVWPAPHELCRRSRRLCRPARAASSASRHG
jgi:hypothetical protein